MKEQYSEEEVNELINWFGNKELPKDLQLNDAIYIPDVPTSIENISSQAIKNYNNPVFNGNIRQLQEIKDKLSS